MFSFGQGSGGLVEQGQAGRVVYMFGLIDGPHSQGKPGRKFSVDGPGLPAIRKTENAAFAW